MIFPPAWRIPLTGNQPLRLDVVMLIFLCITVMLFYDVSIRYSTIAAAVHGRNLFGVFQVPWPNDSIIKWSVFFSEPYFAQKIRMPLNTVGSKLLKRTSNILKDILPQLKYTANRRIIVLAKRSQNNNRSQMRTNHRFRSVMKLSRNSACLGSFSTFLMSLCQLCKRPYVLQTISC